MDDEDDEATQWPERSPRHEDHEQKEEDVATDIDALLIASSDMERSMSVGRMLAMTCSIGGLQMIWSVILSQGVPFLVSMGLSKSLTALVWIAGPICGAFVQPLIGYLSDRSTFSWGRRRPFIVVGTACTIASILMLAWTESAITQLIQAFDLEIRESEVTFTIITLAVFWILLLNISIQPLQVGLRALVVDTCPSQQQAQVNAWASLMIGIGNIAGYVLGFSDLPWFLGYIIHTRFQGLCIIASFILAITVPVTCYFVVEEGSAARSMQNQPQTLRWFQQLHSTFFHLPKQVRVAFQTQFMAWLGWFPYLFYATTFVEDLYISSILPDAEDTSAKQQVKLHQLGVRKGAFATFLAAMLALAATFCIQCLVWRLNKARQRIQIAKSKPISWIAWVWLGAQLFFAVLMFLSLLVRDEISGTVVISLGGISWAVTQWAPYAIIGQEIATKQEQQKARDEETITNDDETDQQAGLVMSLHNTAISVPQIAAALVCSGIFWLAKAVGSSRGVSWCFGVGGLAAVGAAWSSRRLIDTNR